MSALISRPFIKAAAPSHRWGAFCWVQLANGLMAGGNCVKSQANSLSVSLCSMYGGAHSRLTMDLQSLTGHPHCLSQVPSNKSTHKATVPTQFQCHTGKIVIWVATRHGEQGASDLASCYTHLSATCTTVVPHSFDFPGLRRLSESGETR